MRKVLITPQCFNGFRAVLTPSQGHLIFTFYQRDHAEDVREKDGKWKLSLKAWVTEL